MQSTATQVPSVQFRHDATGLELDIVDLRDIQNRFLDTLKANESQ